MTTAQTASRRHGGARTRAYFTGLLGFDREDGYQVQAVDLAGRNFEVSVRPGREKRLVLLVGARDEMKSPYARGRKLAVSFKGEQWPIPARFEELLRAGVAERFGDTTFEDLCRFLAGDPDTWDDRSGGSPSRMPSVSHDAATGLGFSNFLAREDILCQKIISLWSFNPVTLIQLGDRECFGLPHLGLSMVMTINAPWDNHLRNRRRPAGAPARYVEPTPDKLLFYFTDLKEKDVVSGLGAKERAVCDYVFRQNPGVVIFFHACVSVVTGSDVCGTYENCKKKHGLPVLYFRGGDNQNLRDFFKDILVDLRQKSTEAASGAQAVNLVGYSGIMTADLLESLKALKIPVNGLLLPTIDVGAVQRFDRAALSVMLPNVDFQCYYDQLSQGGAPAALRPDAPYGWEGSKRWLALLAEKTGRSSRIDGALAPILSGRRARWEALTARARACSLGIVLGPGDAEQIVDSAYTYGVPLLPLLQEMGFALEFFVHSASAEGEAKVRKVLEPKLRKGGKVSFRRFDSLEKMMELLRASPCRAVFSNYFFDWRITGAGKTIFSLQYFEAGFDGAVRSLERLLGACETGFYRRYGRYLRRDPHGEPSWKAEVFR